MKIAIIGGGINGVMTAWELCKKNHNVTLYEKKKLMTQTSSKSSKLLHGGLRYLENFEFSLVKEALKDRAWWLKNAPKLTTPLKIYIPIYKNSRRSIWVYKIGLILYDFLAGKENIGAHNYHNLSSMSELCSELKKNKLIGGYSYFDGQMDDYKLGLWAANEVKKYKNFTLMENTTIGKLNLNGEIFFDENKKKFDRIINIAGPWASKILEDNDIDSYYKLDLIRGSHIIINRRSEHGFFLEVPNERRIFFALPYNRKTLIGTTEERQTIGEKIKPSKKEIKNLINAYNTYFVKSISEKDITESFSGLRPLIKSTSDPNKVTREYAIELNKNLINVFGGKWTTARQLAKKVANSL